MRYKSDFIVTLVVIGHSLHLGAHDGANALTGTKEIVGYVYFVFKIILSYHIAPLIDKAEIGYGFVYGIHSITRQRWSYLVITIIG
jgi:hypothetical protein